MQGYVYDAESDELIAVIEGDTNGKIEAAYAAEFSSDDALLTYSGARWDVQGVKIGDDWPEPRYIAA